MKRFVRTAFVAGLLVVALNQSARATEVGYSRKIGLGVALGDPTGIVGKVWLSSTNAIDFGLGFQHYGWGRRCDVNGLRCDYAYREFSLNVDYLWQSNLVKGPLQLDWHIGAGGRLYSFGGDNRFEHDFDLGVRMPIGLDFMFHNPNFLELYVEIAPALLLLPLYVDLEGAMGVRLYF